MRQLLQQSESSAQLKCDQLGGGGGGNGFHIRRIGSGKTHFNSFRSDNFACRLTSNEPLDETHLFSVLKLNLERALNDNGAQITESGSSDPTNFYFAYTLKGVRGRVDLSGQRGAVDYYNITANLSESES